MPDVDFTSAFPVLTTDRLTLRELSPTDNKAVFTLRSSKKVNRYINREPLKRLKEADFFISWVNGKIKAGAMVYWVITFHNCDEALGTVCLWNFSADFTSAELGYEMLPKFQGKGIMSEAASRVVQYGFETMKLLFIDAYTHRNNERSTQLLKRNGFVHNPKKTDGTNTDHIGFRLERSAYLDKVRGLE